MQVFWQDLNAVSDKLHDGWRGGEMEVIQHDDDWGLARENRFAECIGQVAGGRHRCALKGSMYLSAEIGPRGFKRRQKISHEDVKLTVTLVKR